MIMIEKQEKTRNYKLRLYPSKTQEKILGEMLYLHCQLYNAAVQERTESFNTFKRKTGYTNIKDKTERKECLKKFKSITYKDQQRSLTTIRKECPEMLLLGCHAAQETLYRVDMAFNSFFTRCKRGQTPGYPRYKSAKRFDSFCFNDKSNWKIEKKKSNKFVLSVTNVGNMQVRGSFPSGLENGETRACTISRSNGKWYAVISMRYHDAFLKRKRTADLNVGMDFGITHLLSMSTGEVIDNPRHIDRAKKRLVKLQRNLSRKKRRSENHKKAAKKVARLHERISNKRTDFLHKLSNRLVRENSFIAVEDLKIKNMTKSAKGTKEDPGKNVRQKAGLNRSLLDASPSRLYSMITYKAEEAGSVVVKVPAPYTSQTCSACGHIDKENRKSQADFVCVSCGHAENADINAAKNILVAGMATTVCGGAPAPEKQKPCVRGFRNRNRKTPELPTCGV